MEVWGVIFLGVIALSSLVQAAFLIGVARSGRRVAQRLDELQERVDREIRPTLDSLNRVMRNVAEISDLGVLQVRRVDEALADTIAKVEETTTVLRELILRPIGPLLHVLAILKGIRKGFEVYSTIGGLESRARGHVRRYAEDEHLFI
jgi:hypothetical protein